MNIKHILISVICAVLLVVGWFAVLFADVDTPDQRAEHDQKVELADEWCDEGLYQRAIQQYQKALDLAEVQETRTKMLTAYELRLKEDNDLYSEYVSKLEASVKLYPTTMEYVEPLIDSYQERGMYKKLYDLLVFVMSNGVEDAYIEKLKLETQYVGFIRGEKVDAFSDYSNGVYQVFRGDIDGEMAADGSVSRKQAGEYVSLAGDNSTRVVTTEEDSRLIREGNFVLGIFENKVTDAGLYSEGLVAAKTDTTYSYYDEFAKEMFGGFEVAGMFKNGFAPVKQDGEWYFIDKTGEKVSQTFGDITLDDNGRWMTGTVFVAADTNGTYSLYTTEWKTTSNTAFENLDRCMADDWVAFQEGDKWGFVDIQGNVKIEAKYENAKSFSNGLAAVCEDGKWGFINRKDELVIPYEYYDADYFNEKGSCMVKTFDVDENKTSENDDSKEESKDDTPKDEESKNGLKDSYALFVLELGIIEK